MATLAPHSRSEHSGSFVSRLPRDKTPRDDDGRRVLVVDDHEDVASWMSDQVRGLGYVVAVAHFGCAALELAASFDPDIVLVDIAMPGMNGWEVARRLRDSDRVRRLIAVSALVDQVHLARSAAAGFETHLPKPLKLAELAALLRKT